VPKNDQERNRTAQKDNYRKEDMNREVRLVTEGGFSVAKAGETINRLKKNTVPRMTLYDRINTNKPAVQPKVGRLQELSLVIDYWYSYGIHLCRKGLDSKLSAQMGPQSQNQEAKEQKEEKGNGQPSGCAQLFHWLAPNQEDISLLIFLITRSQTFEMIQVKKNCLPYSFKSLYHKICCYFLVVITESVSRVPYFLNQG
jgi:hypothetical protein